MRAKNASFVVGLVLAVGCGGSGGGGGGGFSSSASTASGSAPVVSSSRDPNGYTFDLFYKPNGATGGAVTAMTIAPTSTSILAGVSPLGQVDSIDGNTATREAQFVFDVGGFAAIGTQVLAATGNAGAPRSVAIYSRDPVTTAWAMSFAGTQRESAVAILSGTPYAFTGEVDGDLGKVFVQSGGVWSQIADIGSAVPQIATVHSNTLYVGAKAWSSAGGAAKLERSVDGKTWEDLPVADTVSTGQVGRVSAIASIGTWIFVGTETRDTTSGAIKAGSIQFFDEASQKLVLLATFDSEAPESMCFADGTVYVGTNAGRLFFYQNAQTPISVQQIGGQNTIQSTDAFQLEPSVTANGGVDALTVGDKGRLFLGCRGLTGATILRRSSKSGTLPPPPPPSSGPSIASLNPTSGVVGATVTISGSGFDANATKDTVQFNGTNAVVSQASATSLTVTVPAGATTGPVTVAVAGATATGPVFTVGQVTPPKTWLADVKPLLSSQGCTGCHTASHPTFKLGQGDMTDWTACTAETTNPAEASKILTKPTQDGVTHGGGTRFPKGSVPYNTILQWIKDGTKFQ